MTRFDLTFPGDLRFGAGRVDEVAGVVGGWGVRRALVVTGANPARAGGLCDALREGGVECGTFSVAGEPTVELVRRGVEVARTEGFGAVLGVGGGSPLDAAKAIAALAVSGSDPLDHLEVVGAGRPLTQPGLPFVAVPTTAGTGSEVTRNAVLTAAGGGAPVKASLRSPLMLARLAMVDPDLLDGQPARVVAASGMDALSQLLEPFTSIRANPVTDALARDGLLRSARSLERAVTEGLSDPSVREDLALASLLGGLCLANSGLGAVHGFAAALGARFHAPHGAVCAALLAPVVAGNVRALRDREPANRALARYGEAARLLTGRDEAGADDLVEWLDTLRAALGVPGLAQYGVGEEHVAEVVGDAARASSMKANPLVLTEAELTEILRRAR